MAWLSGLLTTLGGGSQVPPKHDGPRFPVGTIIEYNSSSQNAWIPARVLADRPDGMYDLDCKPDVPPDRIRECQNPMLAAAAARGGATAAPAASSGGLWPHPTPLASQPEYTDGEIVEYYSASQGDWIPAQVLAVLPNGAYNLDCKPGVGPSKLRKAPAGAQIASSSRAHVTLPPSEATLPPPSEATLPPSHTMHQHLPTISESVAAVPGASSMDYISPAVGSTAVPAASTVPNAFIPPMRQRGLVSAPTTEQDGPLQLVKVSRSEDGQWLFHVDDAAAQLLEGYGNRPVSVVTVCGPYRTGKSYLLNLLLGRIQSGESQFQVGSTTRACTEGIWMWGAQESTDGSTLVFLDCEGFGSTDSDRTRDAKLMTLSLLLSSVFLLNTKGVLNEGLFNALSLVCHMAEHLESRGDEASKPALLWVLRDFILELQDDNGQAISPDMYLERALQAQPSAGHDADRSRAAREVRECLLNFFPQRNCCTMVQPVIEETQLVQLAEVAYTELRPEFRTQAEDVQAHVCELARMHPKAVAGQRLGGAALIALLRTLVESLNTNKALNVKSAWDDVQHSACGSLLEELRARSTTEVLEMCEGVRPLPGLEANEVLPCRDDVLLTVMKAHRGELREVWRQLAVGDEAVRAEYWRELKQSFELDGQALSKENDRLAEEELKTAVAEWEAFLSGGDDDTNIDDTGSRALSELLEHGLPFKPTSLALREALEAARAARLRLAGRLGTAKKESQLLTSEMESKQKVHEETAAKVDDLSLQQNRDVSRLQSQVDALNAAAREANQREQRIREDGLDAERGFKHAELNLKGKIAEHEQNLKDAKGRAEKAEQDLQVANTRVQDLEKQKKACCHVM